MSSSAMEPPIPSPRKDVVGRLRDAFAPEPLPRCDADAPYDELVVGFRLLLAEEPGASCRSAEELAARWILVRSGCDVWSGI